ncbi:GNAT family N-acetyltransferase [Pluralibacter gergoviae]
MPSHRYAQLHDIPSLITLFHQLGYPTNPDNLAQCIRTPDSATHILVSELNDKICAVLVLHFITPVHETKLWALISALVVDESIRGTGIGQQLLIAAEQIASDRNCSQIALSSSEQRTRAHHFYENNGYKEIRKRFVKILSVPE